MADASDRAESEKVSAGAFPGPLRPFLAELGELRSGGILEMDQVRGCW